MEIQTLYSDEYLLTVSRDELRLINNCINDAMDLMVDAEFQTRTGGFKHEAQDLLNTIQRSLHPQNR
jgi:hypothetical protein